MSFTTIEQATPTLAPFRTGRAGHQSCIVREGRVEAPTSCSSICEDAVAPDDKEPARRNIIEGLKEIDWGRKTMMIRINGLDTHYMYRDVVDIVEACPRLDMILIPKVGVPQDVYALDMLVTQIEIGQEA